MKLGKLSPESAGLTLLAMSEVPNFLAGMAPSLFTLSHMTGKSAEHEQEARESMRRAYIVGGGLSFAVAAGAALVADSWWPIVGTAIVFLVLVRQYEWALASPHETAEELFAS